MIAIDQRREAAAGHALVLEYEVIGTARSERCAKLLIANGPISSDFSECVLINQGNYSDLETGALAIELHS